MLSLKQAKGHKGRRVPGRFLLRAGLTTACLAVALTVNVIALREHGVPGVTLGNRSESRKSPISAGPTSMNNIPYAPINATNTISPTTSPYWQQDFTAMPNGPVDPSVWRFETGGGGWGNNQAQYYTDSSQNARIENGRMVIQANNESIQGYNYTSARLVTRGTFAPHYGTIVFEKVRMPGGAGTWPALWMWPATNKYSASDFSGGSPDLVNGELDIMEYVGASPGEINASAHAYNNYPGHNERSGQTVINDAENAEHDYSLQWTPTSLTFAVDGKPYYKLDKKPTDTAATWPYDQPYFLIMNLAMGGDWGGMNSQQYPPLGINDIKAPWRFTIGAVKYYK